MQRERTVLIAGKIRRRQTLVYIPLINRLRLQYRDAVRTKALVEYRRNGAFDSE
jgi:hypothetical protein